MVSLVFLLSEAIYTHTTSSLLTLGWFSFFTNRLVEDVLGEGAGDKVPMEKVVMLIWAFRDDPTVVTFMARFMAKVCFGGKQKLNTTSNRCVFFFFFY
jgi:hypothetical protein